ncbi:metal ABC transporter solute-binding protein, Zn/Mn family [Paraliobacillus salinarum]|uniref:metal ABC transporter solute-binding protein, Zn/Mn family n=1 Tax=Paraliobacillus salinarum TaxID=1158996 RepID=UPI0015F37235|nr:zinc ABC transporter substrate-binding protein [Paraliobacillus salinarum]
MKKKSKLLLIISLFLIISACSEKEVAETNNGVESQDQLEVYTTIYPLAFFTSEIGGSYVDVNSILPAGADPHSFEPTSKMMVDIAESDLFINNGANLESYAETIKDTLENEEVKIIQATKDMDLLTHTHEHEGHDNDQEGLEDSTHKTESDSHDHGDVDPHVWLDPMLSIELANTIKDALIEQMPEKETNFEENFQQLTSKLSNLDSEFHTVIDHANKKEILVSHAAYGYWEKAYGLKQVAITGLSSSDEPSQKEIEQILQTIEEKNIKYLFFEQNVSSRLASVIQQEAGVETLQLHNLEVLTDEEMKDNQTYFSIMEKNLKALEKALND